MKIVTLMNFKGGCGKSTTAIHLATGAAMRGKRVLLVDADPQAHATTMVGLASEPAFHDLIVRNMAFKKVIRPVPPQQYQPDDEPSKGQLFAIPSDEETRVIPLQITDPFTARKRLQELHGVVDLVIIDTSPTPSLLQTIIYLATDAIIYPTKCEALSFDGLTKSLEHRERAHMLRENQGLGAVEVLGIVPTMVRTKTLEHTEMLKVLIDEFGETVWDVVTDRIVWAEASRLKRPVFAFAPGSEAAHEAWHLVDQLEQRIN